MQKYNFITSYRWTKAQYIMDFFAILFGLFVAFTYFCGDD